MVNKNIDAERNGFQGNRKIKKSVGVRGTIGIALSVGRIFFEEVQYPENRKPSDREGFCKLTVAK